MKTRFLFIILTVFAMNTFAQKETFDAVTYKPIEGWKKERTDKYVSFSVTDEAKGTFCIINLYQALPGAPDSKTNFNNSWRKMIKEPLGTGNPKMEAPETENGWALQTGSAKFTKGGLSGIAMLVTATSQGKMVNMVVMLNSDVYSQQMNDFIASIELEKTGSTTTTSVTGSINTALAGKIWEGSTSEKFVGSGAMTGYNTGGFFTYQYRFNGDGTYRFVYVGASAYTETNQLQYETGTYSVNGNQLSITPSSGTNEEWSVVGGPIKIAGMSDVQIRNIKERWGRRLSTTKRKLEKTTYTMEINYSKGDQSNVMILQYNGHTEREGNGNMARYRETPAIKTVHLPANFK